jgi:hypothetical protein
MPPGPVHFTVHCIERSFAGFVPAFSPDGRHPDAIALLQRKNEPLVGAEIRIELNQVDRGRAASGLS